jgi:hypothetical protein
VAKWKRERGAKEVMSGFCVHDFPATSKGVLEDILILVGSCMGAVFE